jgi:hypothetical protein
VTYRRQVWFCGEHEETQLFPPRDAEE